MKIRDRDLGGRNQVVIAIRQLEEILLELRQLSRAAERVGVDDEWRDHLDVLLLLVNIEHEVDERAIQLRPGTGEDVESGAGDLRGAVEVEDAQRFPEVPVFLRREGERRLLPPGALDAVVRFVGTNGKRWA